MDVYRRIIIVINSAAVSAARCRLSVIINKVAGNIAYRRIRRVINSAASSAARCRLSVIIDKVAGAAAVYLL